MDFLVRLIFSAGLLLVVAAVAELAREVLSGSTDTSGSGSTELVLLSIGISVACLAGIFAIWRKR